MGGSSRLAGRSGKAAGAMGGLIGQMLGSGGGGGGRHAYRRRVGARGVSGTGAYVLISPCRDEQDHMRRTLDSVVAQTIAPALWVIVDDGSTDAGRRYCVSMSVGTRLSVWSGGKTAAAGVSARGLLMTSRMGRASCCGLGSGSGSTGGGPSRKRRTRCCRSRVNFLQAQRSRKSSRMRAFS